jgi:AcrR family transcriptional regulator
MPHAALVPTSADPVLEAARDLTRRDPDWTMTALASAAGISRATLYRRFPGRDAVVAALSRTGDAPADPKTRVLDAFERVAARKGIVATTIADVADEAGCGVATVYRRFGSREGLLSAYAAARTPRALLGELTDDPSGPLRELLHALAAHAIEHLIGHRAALGLALAPDAEERPLVAHLRGIEAEGRAQLAGWFDARVAAGELRGDPRALARAFVGMVGASVLARSEGDEPAPEDEAAWIVDQFLDGCATPKVHP